MKRNVLVVAAVAAATVTGVYCATLSKKKKKRPFKRYNPVPRVDISKEDVAILQILEQSENVKVFSDRYANWLLKRRGLDAVADSIYLIAMRDTGMYAPDELLSKSEECFALNRHREVIEEKLDDINTILDKVLFNLSQNSEEKYHYYSVLSEAVMWERIIPTLREEIDKAVKSQNIGMYESAVTSYLMLLATYDTVQYVAYKDMLLSLVELDEGDWLSLDELYLHTLIHPEQDRIKRILNDIDSQLELNS